MSYENDETKLRELEVISIKLRKTQRKSLHDCDMDISKHPGRSLEYWLSCQIVAASRNVLRDERKFCSCTANVGLKNLLVQDVGAVFLELQVKKVMKK